MADELGNGWERLGKYVLSELQHLREDKMQHTAQLAEISKAVKSNAIALAELRTEVRLRSGLVGGLAGLLPALAVAVYFLLKHT